MDIGKALLLAGVSLCPAAVPSLAGNQSPADPYIEVLSKLDLGSPTGPHYDLSVMAGATDASCGAPVSGAAAREETVFLPDLDGAVRVFLEWGGEGLSVADPCAGFEGSEDAAVLHLPRHTPGYAVFAPVARRPSADGIARIFDPELGYLDAPGDDPLLFLGVIDDEGIFTVSDQIFFQPEGEEAVRDITGLFLWGGLVCYPLGRPEGYPNAAASAFAEECCELADRDGDGVPDQVENCGLEAWDDAMQDDACSAEWLSCVDYSAAETWVFQIPDVASTVWRDAPNGRMRLQIRFYPLPLAIRALPQEGK